MVKVVEIERSIIRAGNHFLYLDGAGWVMIDGPWMRYLDPERKTVHVPDLYSQPVCDFDSSVPVSAPRPADLIWERVTWMNGSPRLIAAYRNRFLSECRIPLHSLIAAIACREKIGWRVWPDGRLPARFSSERWRPEMADY